MIDPIRPRFRASAGAPVPQQPNTPAPDLNGVASALQNAAEVVDRVDRDSQLLEAQKRSIATQTELQEQIAQDTDPDGMEARYQTQLERRVTDVNKVARRSDVADALSLDLARSNAALKATVMRKATGLRQDRAVASLTEARAALRDRAAIVDTPAQIDLISGQYDAMLGSAVQSGFITEAQATTNRLAFDQEIAADATERLIQTNPVAAAQTLAEPGTLGLNEATRLKFLTRAERKVDAERRDIEGDLILIEAARANGSVADIEGDALARASALGMTDEGLRAIERGDILSTIPAMTRPERNALLASLQGEGVSDRRDVDLLAALTKLEGDAVAADARADEKARNTRIKELEKRDTDLRKQAEKDIKEVMQGLSSETPIILDGFAQARADAQALGQGDEFERLVMATEARLAAQDGDSAAAREALSKLNGNPRTVQEGRARQRALDAIDDADKAFADDPIGVSARLGSYGELAVDFTDPRSLDSHARTAQQIAIENDLPTTTFLSKAQRKAFATSFETAEPDMKADLIMTFAQMQDQSAADLMLREAGIADPAQAMAARHLLRSGDQRRFLNVFRGQARLEEKTATAPTETVRKAASNAVLGNVLGPNVEAESHIHQYARALYAEKQHGVDVSDPDVQLQIYSDALQEAAGGTRVSMGGGDTLLPEGMTQDHADMAIDRLTLFGSPFNDPERGARALVNYGTGGAPSFGGSPVDWQEFENARFSLVGDGLYEVDIQNYDGEWFKIERSDVPGSAWIFDIRKAAKPR